MKNCRIKQNRIRALNFNCDSMKQQCSGDHKFDSYLQLTKYFKVEEKLSPKCSEEMPCPEKCSCQVNFFDVNCFKKLFL